MEIGAMRYAKIDRRIWGDARFRRMSAQGRFVFLYLLTNPLTRMVPGAIPAGEQGLAELLTIDLDDFRKGFAEVLSEGLIEADLQARFVWIPKAIRYNMPESPNVIRSWRCTWEELPECDLKHHAWNQLRETVATRGAPWLKAFEEACQEPFVKITDKITDKSFAKPIDNPSPHPSPNKEQEQEQEQEQETTESPQTNAATPPQFYPDVKLQIDDGSAFEIPIAWMDTWEKLFPSVLIVQELRNMQAWLDANPERRKTRRGMKRFIVGWLGKEQHRITSDNGNGARNLRGLIYHPPSISTHNVTPETPHVFCEVCHRDLGPLRADDKPGDKFVCSEECAAKSEYEVEGEKANATK